MRRYPLFVGLILTAVVITFLMSASADEEKARANDELNFKGKVVVVSAKTNREYASSIARAVPP